MSTTYTTLCSSTTTISLDRALESGQIPIAGLVKRGRKGAPIRLMARTGRGEEVTPETMIYVKKAGHQPYSTGYRLRDVPDVEALLRLLESQQEGADTGFFDPRSVALDAVAAFWVKQHEPAKKEKAAVKKRYADNLSKWEVMLAMWPDIAIGSLNKSECEDYANWRTGEPTKTVRPPCPRVCGSMSTVHGDLVLLANAIAEYKAEHQLTWSPTIWIPPKDQGRIIWLRRWQLARICWAIRGRIWDHSTGRWKVKIDPATGKTVFEKRDADEIERREIVYRFSKLGTELGFRHTALIMMRWSPHAEHGYFDLENGIVHRGGHSADPTVGKRRMSSYITKPLLWWLTRWKARDLAAGIDRVIHKRDGTGYRRHIRDLWNEVIADAGLPKEIVPHVMRHTCCTWLKHLRVDVQTAADYVGMHPKTLLRVYGQWSIEGSLWAAEAFADRSLLRQLERSLVSEASPADTEAPAPQFRQQKEDRPRAPMSEETRERVSAGMTALWRARKAAGELAAAI